MILDYYDSKIIDKNLIQAFIDITMGQLQTERFRGYSKHWQDEMIFESLFHMKRALVKRKFDMHRNINPFSYFNQIAYRSFKNWITKENNNHSKNFDYWKFLNGR